MSRHIQTSLSAGEFDPLLWSREDVSFFYNSARIIENAIPLPQGGAKRREGWPFRSLQRGPLAVVSLAGATVTGTNGGTVVNATDSDSDTLFTTVTTISTTAAYEVIRIDLSSAGRVSMWDFYDLNVSALPSGVASATFTVQSSPDGSTWTDRHSILVGTTSYNRRFAQAPNADLANARYWRLILDNSAADDFGSAVVAFSEMALQREAGYSNGGAVGEFCLHRLTSTIVNEYMLYFTQNCCDIYRTTDGVWTASVWVPHTDAQMQLIKSTANLDTLILYHVDQPPWFAQRLGSDGDWHATVLGFDSVVHFPFDSGNTIDGQNEVQFLRFESVATGDKMALEFAGNISDTITWTTSEVTNGASLEAAIEGLVSFSDVTVTPEGTGTPANFRIEYVGNKISLPVPVIIVDILTGSGTAVVSRLQHGRKPKDLLWGAARGYPSCGAFYQGRHWLGGFKARPDLLVGSRAGSLFDFEEDADPIAASPIVVAPNLDEQVTIQNIYPGRHLQIFTSSAELYVPDEPITLDNIALKVTTRHGSSANTKPVDVQGGTMFVDRNGRALREYLFTDTEQSYSAEPISLLAGHLMSSPRSVVLRRARDVDEPTVLLVANTGTDRAGALVPSAMIVIDRAQQITGFFRLLTQGTPLEFGSSQGGDAFAVVRRDLAGTTWNFLEQFDADFMSDCSVSIAGSGSTINLSAYPWLEGQVVEVHGDGLPLGAFTVASGQINLGTSTYASAAEVGLKQVPRIVLHPYKGKGEISPTMQNMRIFRALLQLERTGGLAITAYDGGRPRQVALQNYDSGLMDPTLEEVLFTGPKRISGLGSWQKEPTIEITQIEPMPFLLRSITYDVRF
jgi:hypothetical protein